MLLPPMSVNDVIANIVNILTVDSIYVDDLTYKGFLVLVSLPITILNKLMTMEFYVANLNLTITNYKFTCGDQCLVFLRINLRALVYSACTLLAAGRRSPSAFVMAITSAISTMPFFRPCSKYTHT